jgi:hypothetical protein
MARVGRLAGAILAETEGRYYLVGELKEPCDFGRAGFADPGERGEGSLVYRALTPIGPVVLEPPVVVIGLEGEALAGRLVEFLVIQRNGSVSERLWRLITAPEGQGATGEVDARWLGELPPAVWQIVQESVLRCR